MNRINIPNSLRLEQRQLKTLIQLKKEGGPFTSADEIEAFMQNPLFDETDRKTRLRAEITFARDTCHAMPRNHALFRIFATENGKRRLRTPEEFAAALQKYLGKANTQISAATVMDFKIALENL
jgi:hypothetical protein